MDERIASLQTVESFLFNNKILPVCWDVILWVTGLLHYSVRGFIVTCWWDVNSWVGINYRIQWRIQELKNPGHNPDAV